MVEEMQFRVVFFASMSNKTTLIVMERLFISRRFLCDNFKLRFEARTYKLMRESAV